MHYLIYKITNKKNGKIYIGKHQTLNVQDDYLGSGKLLKKAIQKYGQQNFTKEILFIFDNEKEMNSKEKELVTEEFCGRKDTYNLCPGGYGGFGYINSRGLNDGWDYINQNNLNNKSKQYLNVKKRIDEDDLYKQIHSFNIKRGQKLSNFIMGSHMLGFKHKEETKIKIGKINSKIQKGKGNSQFGTIWITNGILNKKINKEEKIPEGFNKGRV
jgi:hypothetical protein